MRSSSLLDDTPFMDHTPGETTAKEAVKIHFVNKAYNEHNNRQRAQIRKHSLPSEPWYKFW